MQEKHFFKKMGLILMLEAAIFLTLLFLAATPGISLAQGEYILGEDDLLNITVYENDDLATTARINGDNKIAMPLIGEVTVGGLTVRQAEQKIAASLADGFLLNPNVSIFVKEYHSKKVTILGEVDKPGLYELSGDATLLEIISQAGGLTDKAGDEVIIKRVTGPEGSEACTYLRLNLRDLTEKGNLSWNVSVKDKDSIFITKGGYIYVTGQVAKPGAFKYEVGMTVMKAIALAEGLTDKAAPGGTEIIRKQGDNEESIKGEMNTKVEPEDLVSVPESFF
jgi:polysaccharide biosynthesis/export protein